MDTTICKEKCREYFNIGINNPQKSENTVSENPYLLRFFQIGANNSTTPAALYENIFQKAYDLYCVNVQKFMQ